MARIAIDETVRNMIRQLVLAAQSGGRSDRSIESATHLEAKSQVPPTARGKRTDENRITRTGIRTSLGSPPPLRPASPT